MRALVVLTRGIGPKIFVVIFLTITFWQFLNQNVELYPFSAFGMYKKLTPKRGLREYLLISKIDGQDKLSSLDGGQFYLKHRLDKIPFANTSHYRSRIKGELRGLLKDYKVPMKNMVFIIKYWKIFELSSYETPDQRMEFPTSDLFTQ